MWNKCLWCAIIKLLILCFLAAHCFKPPKILQSRQGEVRGSSRYGPPGPVNCSWVITSPVGERVILRYGEIQTHFTFEKFDIVNLVNLNELLKGDLTKQRWHLQPRNEEVKEFMDYLINVYAQSVHLSCISGLYPDRDYLNQHAVVQASKKHLK